jgi:hypothetical protein
MALQFLAGANRHRSQHHHPCAGDRRCGDYRPYCKAMFGRSTALLFEVLRKSYEHLASIAAQEGLSVLQIEAR